MVVILPENQRKHMKGMFSPFPKTRQGADPCSPFCYFVGPLWVNQMATRAARPNAAVEENFSGEKNQACSPTNSTMMVMSVPDEAFKGDHAICTRLRSSKAEGSGVQALEPGFLGLRRWSITH